VLPSQLVDEAPVGRAHAWHELVPHEFTLVFMEQTPLHACVPPGHWPSHAALLSMQLPLHSFWPDGQVPLQLPDTQVAVPPAGAGQGSHDEPQLAGSESLAHAPLHEWVPDLQPMVQVPPMHCAVPAPLGSVGQVTQRSPQAVASLSFAQ